jgi:hypothetical protein
MALDQVHAPPKRSPPSPTDRGQERVLVHPGLLLVALGKYTTVLRLQWHHKASVERHLQMQTL